MSDILQKILATKRREVDEAKAKIPFVEIEALARDMSPPRDFVGSIRAKRAAGKLAVIAEIKKASPSAGVFRAALLGADSAFDPARFARSYEAHGAACLSVLTDRDYFQGSIEDLVAARAACTLPVLRKDFIVDPYQIVEARAMGADAVLFIMGAVPIAHFVEWEILATSLGLTVLAESHSAGELQQALRLKTPLIGVNNRDLTRFTTNIETTLRLKQHVPAEKILVTESGINDSVTVTKMSAAGVGTYLVGGALMESPDPGSALGKLFAGTIS
jgi:indole-3-glycerol phosphate synthase